VRAWPLDPRTRWHVGRVLPPRTRLSRTWNGWWQVQDREVLRRINALIADIERNDNDGIGKPESLEHGFQGYWSRRITDEHRLIHKIAGDEIRIAACRYHYER
jgi:toxin YoeB